MKQSYKKGIQKADSRLLLGWGGEKLNRHSAISMQLFAQVLKLAPAFRRLNKKNPITESILKRDMLLY